MPESANLIWTLSSPMSQVPSNRSRSAGSVLQGSGWTVVTDEQPSEWIAAKMKNVALRTLRGCRMVHAPV
jgi:hypothetical protein